MTDRSPDAPVDENPFTAIPPTEPVEQAPKRKRKSRAKPKVIDASTLVPDLSPEATDTRYWYHLGLVPTFGDQTICSVSIGGKECPKFGGDLVLNKDRTGRHLVPDIYMGVVLAMTIHELEIIANALKSRVWRPIRKVGNAPPVGSQIPEKMHLSGGPPSDAAPTNGQHFAWLRVPTVAEVEAARSQHRVVRQFRAAPGDVAAAATIYLVPLDEEQPRRPLVGDVVPPTVSKTGIILPGPDTTVAQPGVSPIGRS